MRVCVDVHTDVVPPLLDHVVVARSWIEEHAFRKHVERAKTIDQWIAASPEIYHYKFNTRRCVASYLLYTSSLYALEISKAWICEPMMYMGIGRTLSYNSLAG